MKRQGFSLIEVIIATAILMASVFVLSELAGIGRRQSVRARVETRAQEICERTLNEILTGVRPLIDIDREPLLPPGEPIDVRDRERRTQDEEDQLLIFEDPDEELLATFDLLEPEWTYSVSVVPIEQRPGLAVLTVTVRQAGEQFRRPVRFRLTRWIEYPDESEGQGFGSNSVTAFGGAL